MYKGDSACARDVENPLFWELIIVFICIICILIFILTVVPGQILGVRRHFCIVYKLLVNFNAIIPRLLPSQTACARDVENLHG
jgi:hypothetical protein